MEPTSAARYDGLADWYDAQLETAPHRRQVLRAHLPAGAGPCLDLGCGTGRDLALLAGLGWTPVGVDLSADQLRLARGRCRDVVQGDGERLPFRSEVFPLVVSAWTSTDVDHFDRLVAEAGRVLRPGGRFVFYGVHPCFNGPHVEAGPDRTRVVHPTYRDATRHLSSPWWGADGIRSRAGGMRHLPLADFLNAFLDAGLVLEHLDEPGEEPVPYGLVVIARKAPASVR